MRYIMSYPCPFCELETDREPFQTKFMCNRCGPLYVTVDVDTEIKKTFSTEAKRTISITLRNEYERMGRKGQPQEMTIEKLKRLADQFKQKGPLEKMDIALSNINKQTKYTGQTINITYDTDYPYFYCSCRDELSSILAMGCQEGLLDNSPSIIGNQRYRITTAGYQRLREIERPNQESNQAFVAMWFNPSMHKVYKDAIEPAIEFKEPGETESRFKALRIDNAEFLDDINDEIIGQIRRSRFMVCDLTGYRGGVYFEAGFAYGLGIPVIYTCRKDWTKHETLTDAQGNEIKELYDKKGQSIRVGKEGVHFDLNHRNRIEWHEDELGEFRVKLERRIKAAIF